CVGTPKTLAQFHEHHGQFYFGSDCRPRNYRGILLIWGGCRARVNDEKESTALPKTGGAIFFEVTMKTDAILLEEKTKQPAAKPAAPPAMTSDTIKRGLERAPHRSLLRA